MTTTYATDFQGWWPTAIGEATPIRCPSSQAFVTYGTYADCLPSGSSAVPTACSNDVLSYNNQGTPACGRSASCYTMTLAMTSPLNGPLTTRYMCVETDWTYDTLYRNYQISTTSSPLSTSSSETSTIVTSTPTSTPTSTSASTSTSDTTSTTSPDSTTSNQGVSSLSGGAIAGIVIGGVVAVCLLVAFLLRRYRVWPFRKRVNDIKGRSELAHRQELHIVHEIGSSGSVPQKSNTVHEMAS